MTNIVGKRLLFPEVGRIEWETFELPIEPGPYIVIAEAICSLISAGTELALYTGTHIGFTLPDPPFPMMPQRPGYAFVGRVLAVGNLVQGIEPGQRVLIEAPHGTHAVADVRQTTVVILPDEISAAQGALIRMAYIALSAVRVAPLQLGEIVVVYGLGLVGLLAAQLFRLNGAHPVIGIDLLPERLATAETLGIYSLHAGETDVQMAIADLTGEPGPDVVIEATGDPRVLVKAFELVGRGGRVVLLGSTRTLVEMDVYSHIHRKGVRVIGAHESVHQLDSAHTGRWTKQDNLRLLARLFATGSLLSEGLICHKIAPSVLLEMYDILVDQPQDYLGVLVDWHFSA